MNTFFQISDNLIKQLADDLQSVESYEPEVIIEVPADKPSIEK